MTYAPKALRRPLLLVGSTPLLALLLAPLAAHATLADQDAAVRLAVAQMQDLSAMLRPQSRQHADRQPLVAMALPVAPAKHAVLPAVAPATMSLVELATSPQITLALPVTATAAPLPAAAPAPVAAAATSRAEPVTPLQITLALPVAAPPLVAVAPAAAAATPPAAPAAPVLLAQAQPAAAVPAVALSMVAAPVAVAPVVAAPVVAATAPVVAAVSVPTAAAVIATPQAVAPALAAPVTVVAAVSAAPVAAAPAAVPVAFSPPIVASRPAAEAAEPVAAMTVPQLLAASAPAAAPPLLMAAAPVRVAAAVAVAEPRFDLSVNNAPAAQVFLQLANGTGYNMLVAPEVSGQLSITLKDTTVAEAMDTLRELFGYEYRITGNRIFVYPNTVQTRLYKVNYLPGRRQGASDTRVTSSAITLTSGQGGASGGGGGNNANNNSSGSRGDDSAHVRTTSDADFWREVQSSLTAMVGSHGGRNVVLNPAAGVVVVKATPAELRQVENYLKAVQLSIERQVMLEAKIVEVQLNRDAQTGINWAGFGKLGSGKLTIGSAAPGTTLGQTGNLVGNDGSSLAPGVNLAAGALGKGFYGLAFQAANFAALLNFLQTQGDVQVLSSPRIATLNNQKAVLKVGSDELYVTGVTTTTTASGTGSVTSPSLTLQPFFSGISLDVTPQIDDVGNVMLHVHPTISVVTEKQKNIDLGALGSFRLPLAASTVNETDSIVRVKDGQIVAIGGLMKHTMIDERTGLPVLSDAPVVGGLFRQSSTIHSKRELVIMLKPTIIQEDGVWPEAPTFGGPMGAAQAAQTKR